jgi:hypothetical protein
MCLFLCKDEDDTLDVTLGQGSQYIPYIVTGQFRVKPTYDRHRLRKCTYVVLVEVVNIGPVPPQIGRLCPTTEGADWDMVFKHSLVTNVLLILSSWLFSVCMHKRRSVTSPLFQLLITYASSMDEIQPSRLLRLPDRGPVISRVRKIGWLYESEAGRAPTPATKRLFLLMHRLGEPSAFSTLYSRVV